MSGVRVSHLPPFPAQATIVAALIGKQRWPPGLVAGSDDEAPSKRFARTCGGFCSCGAINGPCSPDLNPIEEAFAKLKQLLRKVQARTVEATLQTNGNSSWPLPNRNVPTISSMQVMLQLKLIRLQRPKHRPIRGMCGALARREVPCFTWGSELRRHAS
jgi:hypothetical protein